jgi:hypothetical protein
MPSMIDQIRASKLPSGMMQFAARGALQVPAAENIEILVHLAVHNKVFGELARMTLAGWDEKSSCAAAADPQTPREVLDYFSAHDNLRPVLVPVLLENPSVPENQLVKLATSASRETIAVMLKSPRIQAFGSVLAALKGNPYLRKEDAAELEKMAGVKSSPEPVAAPEPKAEAAPQVAPAVAPSESTAAKAAVEPTAGRDEAGKDDPEASDPENEEAVSAYLRDHAGEIAAEGDKPFQSVGGVVEILGGDYFPVTQSTDVPEPETPVAVESASTSPAGAATAPARAAAKKPQAAGAVRENALQKINRLDVKGRIQLALKGNKEERSLLIRDGTKVVALSVLEAPKLSDGEVEKFASQKNVLEAVLRQIPLKRRFMKNYIVVRNLVANPRTPLDLGLNLMKNILPQDLKNISGNKDVSETIRKLALKMYKQKMEAANKK